MRFFPSRSSLPRAARAVAAAVAAIAALSGLPTTAAAQTSILEPVIPLSSLRIDSASVGTDTTEATSQKRTVSRRTSHLFYGALLTGAALSFNYRVDPDEGGYEDKWNTLANFPDKGVHALAAFALTGVGVDLGARPWVAAASVCAAGAAFELSQGYVSKIDIAADCVGAAGAALWRTWRTRVNEREGR